MYRRQSSAKRRTSDFTASGRSLMWHRKRIGPKTVPGGTTGTLSDSLPSTSTFTRRLVRNVEARAGVPPRYHRAGVPLRYHSCLVCGRVYCGAPCQKPLRSPGWPRLFVYQSQSFFRGLVR